MISRRFIILVLLLVLSINLSAADTPIDKGAAVLGGQAAFSKYSGDLYGNPDSYYSLNMDFTFQRFFWQGITLGVDFVYDLQSVDDLTQYTIAAGPLVGIFYGSDERRLIPYFQGSLVFGKIQGVTYTWVPFERDKNLVRPSFTVGLMYLIAEYFALNGGLKYSLNITKADGVETLKESRLGVQIGLNLLLY